MNFEAWNLGVNVMIGAVVVFFAYTTWKLTKRMVEDNTFEIYGGLFLLEGQNTDLVNCFFKNRSNVVGYIYRISLELKDEYGNKEELHLSHLDEDFYSACPLFPYKLDQRGIMGIRIYQGKLSRELQKINKVPNRILYYTQERDDIPFEHILTNAEVEGLCR